MEEIFESVVKSIVTILARLVREVMAWFWTVFFRAVAWYSGWIICRTFTFGHYPQQGLNGHAGASVWIQAAVSLVGLVCLVGVGTGLARLSLASWQAG